MTRQPEQLPAEPRRTCGGAGGAARGQWVQYPLRVVTDAEAYAPADTNFYGKVKALSKGRPATASMDKITGFLGWSKSSGERSSRRLGRPAVSDGVQELFTKRKTHKITGTGQTAERWCRDLDKNEPYVWGPVRAVDTLRGILHRLYLGLRHAIVVRRHQPTLAELAQLLRHHGGRQAGQALAEATVSRLLDELETLGWITLDKRAGYRGRHAITVHDDPVHPLVDQEPTPDPGDGSGPDLADGSPAYKEDQELNDPRNTPPGGPFRRRRDDRSYRPCPVENPVAPVADTFRPRQPARPTAPPAYAGPQLTLSPRVWAVLEPVADLLPRTTPFAVRRIAREIGHQLDSGIWPDEIRDQLARLRAWTPAREIRDPGRWLLGAVLPVRSDCGMTGCHWGFLAHTGQPCKACAEIQTARRQRPAHPPHTGARHECADCQRPTREPLPAGLCNACRPTA